MGYCDNLKPAISCIEDFYTIEKAVTLYEQSSGCKLHRDIKSKKCKISLLGKWKDWHQDSIPFKYIAKSDHLDMLGVQLFNNYVKTRQENCESIIKKIKNKIDMWKLGKFMPLSDRARSVNIYAYSNIWFRTSVIDMRKGDEEKILSMAKSYIYMDLFEKPEEILLFRKKEEGGLGLKHISYKAQALKIKNFIQMAANEKFIKML